MIELVEGDDFRLPELRRETFLRFFMFHVEHRSHPGAVYYLMPELRARLGWDDEAALWFAFINGLTQHPVTSLLVHRRFPEPSSWEALGWWWQENLARLRIDTDRRHQKRAVPEATAVYYARTAGDQAGWWSRASSWADLWSMASSLPSFGRLSAWSYLEYVRIMGGHELDAATLLLDDVDGSRSHRNGLALVAGRDDLDRFTGPYAPADLGLVTELGEDLLGEACSRATVNAGDVLRLTLESALCTYKSWHRPNRRYPNVYNDMLHDRIRDVERLWPDEDLSILWAIRRDVLPEYLRLEDNPHDPGVAPIKQNWYRETGCPPMMHRTWPCFANDLNRQIDAGELPARRAR